ncbi:A/G-specific adenine glycosylase [Candidatus Dependentiae bacterium]|nr:A/G-specific adenine glycosylase [Candidatus Dependentiae bacterium]
MDHQEFIAIIKQHYALNRRSFIWREEPTPYHVFISEVMLQQTQTFRVAPKFVPFVETLPNFSALAQAPFSHILALWKGLGYNSRALRLQQAAMQIMQQHAGQLPQDPVLLRQLPGIGAATASSIAAFAYQLPTVFIETNIRTVFIHHFFPDRLQAGTLVHDNELRPLVAATLDRHNPRDWYYALMDYGVMLKKSGKNFNAVSKHYTQQSKFEGSNRQMRGKILQLLLEYGQLTQEQMQEIVGFHDCRVDKALSQLLAEQLVLGHESGFCLNR